MSSFLTDRRVEICLRYLLGVTFIYASIHKIAAPAEFAKILYGYGLFPHITINLIAIVIPFLELFSGTALIIGIYPRGAGALIALMLLMFTLVISINLIRGHTFHCGCFSFNGDESPLATRLLLVRDVVLLGLCWYLLRFDASKRWGVLLREKGRPGA